MDQGGSNIWWTIWYESRLAATTEKSGELILNGHIRKIISSYKPSKAHSMLFQTSQEKDFPVSQDSIQHPSDFLYFHRHLERY